MTDAAAECELVRLRAGMLAYARHIVVRYPQIDGEDLVQAAYMHAWARRENIRYADAMLMYVRKAVRNALIDVLRSGNCRFTAPMDAGEYAPDSSRHMEKLEARIDAERLVSLVRVTQFRNAMMQRLCDEVPEPVTSTYKVRLHRGIKAARAAA
jgi:DNA-directed RNA polymerase specialized sigma24 family protein